MEAEEEECSDSSDDSRFLLTVPCVLVLHTDFLPTKSWDLLSFSHAKVYLKRPVGRNDYTLSTDDTNVSLYHTVYSYNGQKYY